MISIKEVLIDHTCCCFRSGAPGPLMTVRRHFFKVTSLKLSHEKYIHTMNADYYLNKFVSLYAQGSVKVMLNNFKFEVSQR